MAISVTAVCCPQGDRDCQNRDCATKDATGWWHNDRGCAPEVSSYVVFMENRKRQHHFERDEDSMTVTLSELKIKLILAFQTTIFLEGRGRASSILENSPQESNRARCASSLMGICKTIKPAKHDCEYTKINRSQLID